jgi:CRISPR/Cas system-associated protein Cas10 (large subunit of type III CRISPR-Cas system)
MHRSSSRVQNKKAKTCYDAFLSGAAGVDRKNLCPGCIHFMDEPVKSKERKEMGRRFQCCNVRKDGYEMPRNIIAEEIKRPASKNVQAVPSNVPITACGRGRSKISDNRNEIYLLKMKVRKLEEEKFQLEEEKVQLEEENAHL